MTREEEPTITFKKLDEKATIPSYAHEGDAGMDVYNLETRTLEQGEPHAFSTGIASEFPKGWVAMLCDRSSMGKKGIRVLGGIIDAQYRGEWKVVLVNLTKNEILLKPGDRIAQALLLPVANANSKEGNLSETERGTGGFGSTGR